jgi:hypothetical protein
LHKLIDAYLAWSLTVDTAWNGLVWIIPTADKLSCGATWLVRFQFVISGAIADSEANWKTLLNAVGKSPVGRHPYGNATQMQQEDDEPANDLPIVVSWFRKME